MIALGVPLRVPVRGVDEVSAAVDVGVEDSLRLLRLRAPAPLLAERHGSEAERADAETGVSDRDVVSEGHAADRIARDGEGR